MKEWWYILKLMPDGRVVHTACMAGTLEQGINRSRNLNHDRVTGRLHNYMVRYFTVPGRELPLYGMTPSLFYHPPPDHPSREAPGQ